MRNFRKIVEKFLLCKKYLVKMIREEHDGSINQRDVTVVDNGIKVVLALAP